MTTSIVTYPAGGGDPGQGYLAKPDGAGPFPGVLLVHHILGWDEFHQEFARRLANQGFVVLLPNFFVREGVGSPDDIAAKVRGDGGLPDDQVVADAEAAVAWLKAQPFSNGKVGVTGPCSGGRHSVLIASRVPTIDAVADLWGGRVVMTPEQLTAKTPVAPIDYTAQLNVPILGLFGNDDTSPSPADVNKHEEALKAAGKNYVFHRYDGAGHGFFYYDRPMYRVQAAMDGWNKLLDFFGQNLKA